jgi:hypothetical protein
MLTSFVLPAIATHPLNLFKAVSALALSTLLASTALADIVNVPARRPVVTIDVPDSWKP